ncbi:hypothetical protein AVEN_224076-1 [Araneus ventricosus]|uniref:DNA helicase Pif1-like 2B domain-containing protein n=1 Tax=Araneus ventricosus TaxID=182803 RepID=A0A4Y2IVX8_ARAVE|nr:hypothetical protein AVEN_224076-1 [Araneus ventricosus]
MRARIYGDENSGSFTITWRRKDSNDKVNMPTISTEVLSVNDLIEKLLQKIPGNPLIYKSIDTVIDEKEFVNYPPEFLNSLEVPGLPPHKLQLKVGAPINLERNLDQRKLCNGTRLIIKAPHPHVIESQVQSSYGKGKDIYINSIPLITSEMPFQFKRLQFPVRLGFAMSINKSQGQTLKVVGLHLQED